MNEKILLNKYITGPLEVNTYLIADIHDAKKPAAIIDPAGKNRRLEADIEKLGVNPRYIINTHSHIDHVAFNNYYKKKYGCDIFIHKDDADHMNEPHDDFLFKLIGGELSAPPDKTLNDGESFLIGSIELKIIHTPGHSPGGICLQGDGFLISGDTLFEGSIGRTDLPGGNYNDLITSIREKILVLPDDTLVFPGHGEQTTVGEEKELNPFLQI